MGALAANQYKAGDVILWQNQAYGRIIVLVTRVNGRNRYDLKGIKPRGGDWTWRGVGFYNGSDTLLSSNSKWVKTLY